MKAIFSTVALSLLVLLSGCCSRRPAAPTGAATTNTTTESKVVEAGCGQCLFGLNEPVGCDLAVRVDGKPYFVDGFKMSQFGDAHAADGMCQAIRKAKVTGNVVNGRFAASTFELVPSGH